MLDDGMIWVVWFASALFLIWMILINRNLK